MIILRPVENLGLAQKRISQSVALIGKAIDGLCIKSIAHDQKAVLVKGLSLLWVEMSEIQRRYPFYDFRSSWPPRQYRVNIDVRKTRQL